MSPLDEKWVVTALHIESRFIKPPTLLSQRLHPCPNVIHGSALALMKNISEKASFNRCSSHSHDLCGKYSFSKTRCVTFFGTLESMYTFFSSSTHRWEVLKYYSGFFKCFCKTRWSAQQDAVETIISLSLHIYLHAIEKLTDDKENFNTRRKALGLQHAVCNFSFLYHIYFWANVLEKVDQMQ